MSLNAGQSPKGDAQMTETRTAAETISPGDAVALDSNDELIPANSGSSEVVYGVAGYGKDGSDYASGDLVKVTVGGPVVASMASGVAGGVEVGPSTTDGQLAAGTSVKGILTMYAEGSNGANNVPSIPADHGYVRL